MNKNLVRLILLLLVIGAGAFSYATLAGKDLQTLVMGAGVGLALLGVWLSIQDSIVGKHGEDSLHGNFWYSEAEGYPSLQGAVTMILAGLLLFHFNWFVGLVGVGVGIVLLVLWFQGKNAPKPHS